MDEPTAAPAPAPDAAPPERQRRLPWLRLGFGLAGYLASAVAVVALALGALWWLLRTEPGTAWLVRQWPGLTVEDPTGVLLGDFGARRVHLALGGDGATLQILGLRWRGLSLQPAAGQRWVHLGLDELKADRVDVTLAPGPATDTPVPTDLVLPMALDVAALQIDELHIDTLQTPLRALRAAVHLGADDGARHRLDDVQALWDRLRLSGGAQVATTGTLQVQARLTLTPQEGEDGAWVADARLEGPLAQPQLQVQLRATPAGGQPAQSLDATATLRPFAAWPLGTLQARAEALDLNAWHRDAPRTALDLDVQIQTQAQDQPAAAKVLLANRLPGRWSDTRLPLRRLELLASARPDDPSRIEVQRFDAELGQASQSAGRLSGRGQVDPQRWQFEVRLAQLQPALLDARAPDMRLDGRLQVAGPGLKATGAGRGPLELRGELDGDGLAVPGKATGTTAPRLPVQLRLDLRAQALRLELREALLRSGDAHARISGVARRERASAGWSLQGQASLGDFDPSLWWPGSPGSAWRQGPHRLQASGEFDLQLPATARAGSAWQQLAQVTGRALLTLAPSQLAGVPLSGSLGLQTGATGEARLQAQIDAAGNRLRADGRVGTRDGDGAGDHWQLDAEMPALDRLQPWWRLLQPAEGRLAGALQGSAMLDGRWPAVSSQGQLTSTGLRAGALTVQAAQARWKLGSRLDDVLDAELALTQFSWGRAGFDGAQAQLKGTPRAHGLQLQASSKVLPPVWVERLRPAPANAAARRSEALLQAQGGFKAEPAWGAWQGTLRRLQLRGDAPGAPAWAEAKDVPLTLQWADGPLRVQVGASRIDALGAALRVEHVDWTAAHAARGPAQLDARALLEPLDLAPLLALAQPDFGWGGDLRIEGEMTMRSTPDVRADVVLQRAGGDLTVTDDAGTQALGLSDLRLGLNAADGVWSFTAGLAGKTLGQAAGAVVARTTPRAPWPAADTPIEGVLELQVGNLGVWGPWVPAGWRLGGEMRIGAAIGGRFGAPQYTGEWTGRNLHLRNLLQGVDFRDGDLAVALQGETARIERFTARAGSGTAEIKGGAVFSDAPKAELELLLDRFQVLGRVDRRIVASGATQLRLERDAVALEGRLRVDEGLIDFGRSEAPGLSEDVSVRRPGQAEPVPASLPAATDEPPPPPPRARNVKLDLRVDMGDKLRIRGRGLDAGLRGELHLTAPQRRLRVEGKLQTVGGTYRAYRQNLVIERGVLIFNGPVENPQLDIEATRPNLDVRVGVAVSGTVLVPRIRLFSEPEMSEIDKLSWLVRGRPSEGAGGGADTALLQAAALALVSGEETTAIDQIFDLIGLDDLSVRQADGSSGGAIVSVGKQLSRNWYIGYERGLNAATGTFQVVYRIAQRFTVRVSSGDRNAIELIWTWRWN